MEDMKTKTKSRRKPLQVHKRAMKNIYLGPVTSRSLCLSFQHKHNKKTTSGRAISVSCLSVPKQSSEHLACATADEVTSVVVWVVRLSRLKAMQKYLFRTSHSA